MNTKKIFLMSALAFLVCSCQEDEGTSIQPTPGEEVKFGGRLDASPMTRTIYGESDGNGFPIYWVDGDQVLVASPQCAIGSATYAISVDGLEQNYATSMDKTGEAGVQWGDNATANFYSIYPASSYTRFTQSLTSARLTVTTQQNNTWNTETNTVSPDMSACFMYAKTENVPSGDVVDLAYKPLSTAVRFTVRGPMSGDPVTISHIRLYAPTGVALSGTFNVDFTQTGSDGMPVVSAITGRTYNYASMNAASSTGAYLTLASGESADVQLFFLLEREITMDKSWYIEVATTSGTYIKNLTADETGGNMTLKPGQIHILPALPTLDAKGDWDPANWMVNIQRNVYLSEISIPGSWNSLNPDYQGENPSLTLQYEAGVRAFHLDTRWIASANRPNDNEIVGLGIANGGDTYYEGAFNTGGQFMQQGACPTFADALTEITRQIRSDEYMVVYCTFAQGSAQLESRDWRTEIAQACQNNEVVIDARTLDANSTVADVLGNVIVIVSTKYENEEVQSKSLFVNLQNELDQSEYTNSDYLTRQLVYNNLTSTSSGINVNATYATITHEGDGTGSTGDRGYEPTLSERQTKCENLLNESQTNYNGGTFQHNIWIFMGLGGYVYQDDGLIIPDYNEHYELVNNQLVLWLDTRLTTMENNEAYYPVGIVFMNDVLNHREGNDVDISTTVENILQLNNRYRKAYDPDRSPVDGSYISGGGSAVSSAAPGYSSGMTDNRTNAIVW